MNISVIIPTLNEAANLTKCFPCGSQDVEVIIADCGSRDETTEVAAAQGWRVCLSRPGRAAQMNAGAGVASGEIFVFLHADTRLPEDFAVHIRRVLSEPDTVAGAFHLQIDSPMRGLRIIERLANWRSVRWQLPFGDQAIFLRADRFRTISGFPDLPILEDVELIRRLRKHGRIRIAPAPVVTSARRWLKKGLWKTTLLNQACLAAYYLGISPVRIHSWYYGAGTPSESFDVSTKHIEHVGAGELEPKHGG